MRRPHPGAAPGPRAIPGAQRANIAPAFPLENPAFFRFSVSSVASCSIPVCDWFGPTDFTSNPDHGDLDQIEARLIGGPISQNLQKAQRASPIHYITKDDPPFLIVHGDKDPAVPLQQSQLLADALKKNGVQVTFHVVPGGGHGGPDFVKPDELERLFVFFAKTLKSD